LFYGEFQHTIDPKGRVILPSTFREELGEKFIMTKGLDGCLFVYSMTEWSIFETKLRALPLANIEARAFVRLFSSGASPCDADKQGRTVIPQNLRSYAGLEKDIYIIGATTRIEVWDKAKWESYSKENDLSTAGAAEKMSMLGI
jgi:MraZ protein